MPGLDRQDSYRSALNMALMELNQLAEQVEELKIRKGKLQIATDGLRPLLVAVEQQASSEQRPPLAPSQPEHRVTEFPSMGAQAIAEPHPVIRFQQAMDVSTDPLQNRIQNALITPASA